MTMSLLNHIGAIDAHQHFWKYSEEEYPWMEGAEKTCLRMDRLPEDLWKLQDACGFVGSVAVQARQSLEETRWLLNLADEHERLFGVVGWIDLCSETIEDQLIEFSDHSKLVGVRHVVQDEPDDNYMMSDAFRRGIGLLNKHGLSYDILIYPRQLKAALDIVQRNPDQRFVLDHLAKPSIRSGNSADWEKHFRALAEYSNVTCKLSGLVTEADWSKWTRGQITPFLDKALEAFTSKRLMIGSDWPVCTLAADYSQVMEIVTTWAGRLSQSEQVDILRNNAIHFYQLSLTQDQG